MVTFSSLASKPGRKLSALAGRYAPAAVLALTLVAVSLITRVCLIVVHGGWASSLWSSLAKAFAAGAVYDIAVALWLVMPTVACLTLGTDGWLARRAGRWSITALLFAGIAGALFVAIAEIIFFAEFDGRFNFVAVDYLIYPTEVVTNIWESYPTAWLLVGIALAASVLIYIARPIVRSVARAPAALRARVTVAGLYGAALTVISLTLTPALARVSDDRALNEVASNGYYTFWQAFLGQGTSYGALYATRDTAATIPRIHQLLANESTPVASFSPRTTLRRVPASRPDRRLNVVVVLEESLGSQFIGALHPASPSLTPRFDSLAAAGTLFTRAYSTGNRTIRALEATTSSLPPLPGISVVRRPESVDLFTLPSLLRSRGYATQFVYGGRAMFDGMGAYMRNNGIEHVIEQSDFPSGEFTTAWGVSDEAIFTKALASMDSLYATGQPFYTLLLSVSNHRPYTYPSGRIAADPDERKRINVVQYADWALGKFVADARRHAFFDSTIFVLMGDHGPRVYGAAEIPLPSYSVPIVFYGPGIIAAGKRIDDLASSMDVPPTVLGLLGGSYESKFFGRDLLSAKPSEGLAVMTHNNEIALMRNDRVAVLGLRGATTVYDIGVDGTLRRVEKLEHGDRKLVEDAIAYFQTADEMFHRNEYRFTERSPIAATPASRPATLVAKR